MKKMMKLSFIVLMAFFTASVTPCSDDNDYYYEGPYDNSQDILYEMVRTLRGYWTGKIAAHFKDPGGLLREEIYNTGIKFDMYDSGSCNGYGCRMDYPNGEIVYGRMFSWAIDSRSGGIIITYDGENGEKFRMIIDSDDMKLNDHTFSGMTVDTGESDEFSYTRYACAKKVTIDFEE